MTEWHPSIVEIEKVDNHPNADRLDIATVLGNYPVIVKRGEYKVGDRAAYIPVDTVVPDNEMFHFLAGDKYPVGGVPEKRRIIKAKRLRDIFSMGLLVSAEGAVGDSVVELLGLKKWEEEEEENSVPEKSKPRGDNKSNPKDWQCPYYDVEGIRKYYQALVELNEPVVISEKLHGANIALTHDGSELWVKSRNYFKKSLAQRQRDLDLRMAGLGQSSYVLDAQEDMWWDVAIRYGLEELLAKKPMLTFFGEVYGQVSKFPYDRGSHYSKFRAFDIYSHKEGRYLDHKEFIAITSELGIEIAPILYEGELPSFEEIRKMASGMTTLGGKHIREGVVVKTLVEKKIRNHFRAQFKFVSEEYLLAK